MKCADCGKVLTGVLDVDYFEIYDTRKVSETSRTMATGKYWCSDCG